MGKITAPVTFRTAEKEDLLANSKQLRMGQAYLVMNGDGKTLSGFHITDPDTDAYELASWFQEGRVYVPIASVDAKIQVQESSSSSNTNTNSNTKS